MADIWFFHRWTFWCDALVGVFALASIVAHREFVGFGWRAFAEAVRAWRAVFVACAIAVAVGCVVMGHPAALFARGLIYFVWCVVQQILLQLVIYRRVRRSWIAALLFALVHWPNPVLVPATFAWGFIATRLFDRHPSIFALAMMQVLLSSLSIWIAPAGWSHQYRVGPGYRHAS